MRSSTSIADTQNPELESKQLIKTRHALTPLAAAMIAVLHPGSAVLAQEDTKKDDSNDFTIEEIIVTATKRQESLQDVDQSISTFGTDAIEKMQFKNMEDYLKALPSAQLTSAQPGRNSLQMRGISTGSYEYRTESQVAMYLDEQPITSISQMPEVRMVDIARIESLPGPQGTLFGASSQSGTMRIITNKPSMDRLSGQMDASLGTTQGGDSSYDVSGHLNIPVNDKFALRLVGFASHDGGYVDVVPMDTYIQPEPGFGVGNNADVVGDNQNTYDQVGGRIHALWLVNDKWTVDASLIGQKGETNGTWESDPGLGDYKVAKFFDEYRNDQWWQASATFTGDLGFAEFTSTTSYFERESDYRWDNMAYFQEWTYVANYTGYYVVYDFNYASGGTVYNDQIQTRFAQEFRLASQSESKLQWMVGAFYDNTYDEWDYGFQLPDGVFAQTDAWYASNYSWYGACYYAANGFDVACPMEETNWTYYNNMQKTVKQTAIFGELSYDLTDKLTATVGYRWFENDRKDYNLNTQPFGKAPPGAYWGTVGTDLIPGLEEFQGKTSNSVGKLSVKYALNDDAMVYGTISEGFRLGGTNNPRAVAEGWITPEYKPDKMTNYEIGAKTEWLNRRLTLNVSAYLMEWDDIQVNSRVGPTWREWWARGTWNGTTGESKGLELNGTFHVTQNFMLEGNVYMGKSEFTGDSYASNCLEGDLDPGGDPCEPYLVNGTPMPVSPSLKYWLAAEYTVPNAFDLPGDLWFRYDTSFQDEVWDNTDSAAEGDVNGIVPSWRSSNLQVGLSLDNEWTIRLMARNVWNNQGINDLQMSTYYADWFEGVSGQDPGWGRYIRTYQRPRTISLSLTKRF